MKSVSSIHHFRPKFFLKKKRKTKISVANSKIRLKIIIGKQSEKKIVKSEIFDIENFALS